MRRAPMWWKQQDSEGNDTVRRFRCTCQVLGKQVFGQDSPMKVSSHHEPQTEERRNDETRPSFRMARKEVKRTGKTEGWKTGVNALVSRFAKGGERPGLNSQGAHQGGCYGADRAMRDRSA